MSKKTFLIEVPVLVYVTHEIEAESKQEAIDKSKELDFSLDYYIDNDNGENTIVGVVDLNMNIEIASDPLKLNGFDVKVTEL